MTFFAEYFWTLGLPVFVRFSESSAETSIVPSSLRVMSVTFVPK